MPTNHTLNFTFNGTTPTKVEVQECILGTLPKGTVVNAPWPGAAAGPWSVTTPAIGKSKSELNADAVEGYFDTGGSAHVCPFVNTVAVT